MSLLKGLYTEFPRMQTSVIDALYKITSNNLELTRKAICGLLGIEMIAPNLIVERHTKTNMVDCSGSLVCEIAADLSMSEGYPEQFRKRFGQLYGKADEPLIVKEADNRFIYYLVTKERYFHDRGDLTECLILLRKHIVANGVEEIAVCNLDTEWFKGTTVKKINVYPLL